MMVRCHVCDETIEETLKEIEFIYEWEHEPMYDRWLCPSCLNTYDEDLL